MPLLKALISSILDCTWGWKLLVARSCLGLDGSAEYAFAREDFLRFKRSFGAVAVSGLAPWGFLIGTSVKTSLVYEVFIFLLVQVPGYEELLVAEWRRKDCANGRGRS